MTTDRQARSVGVPTVGVALVTHNGMRWIDECLRSILDQTRAPDRIVIVDDASTDGTREHLRDRYAGEVEVRPAPAADPSLPLEARIAANFAYAVQCCGTELVALSDQDDRWLPNRLSWQVEGIGTAAMLASDGYLINDVGDRLPGRLRQAFAVPADFQQAGPAQQFRYALHHSLATGGASLMCPGRFTSLSVPAGWLHDRWWSLVATAMQAMIVDPTCVIEYRVSAGQVMGLDRGLQAAGPARRIAGGLLRGSAMARLTALHGLRSWDGVAPEVAGLLGWPQLLRAVMTKPGSGGG